MAKRNPTRTKAAAAAEAIVNTNARKADEPKIPRKEEPNHATSKSKLLLLSFLVFVIAAYFSPSSQSSFATPPSTLSAFDEFYSTNVQPLLDRGMMALNGTRDEEKSRVGYRLRHAIHDFADDVDHHSNEGGEGAQAKHPIVLIPGFVTTGLELWEGHDCFKKHFRQRLWGSVSMARTFFLDRECWRRHLALDPKTGLDPKGIRLRSAQGFEAADNFVASYWVFSKMIENLADVGYDGTKMTMMSYDWRLGYAMLEKRDGYFTKLKLQIEAHFLTSGEKVVLVSHSMGGTVVYYFLQWVVTDVKNGGGGGGKKWVEKHIHAFVNIAGTLLGVPKAIPALLSGELKDTAAVFVQFAELLERYFGRKWRKNLWNTWGSLFGMLPKGGDSIWGIGADVVVGEDNYKQNGTKFRDASELFSTTEFHSFPTITWTNASCPNSPFNESSWTMDQTLKYIYKYGGGYQDVAHSKQFSHDYKNGWKTKMNSKEKQKHWHDPIATPLPRAPSMKIYCLYGVGVPTERSYYYKVDCEKVDEDNECIADEHLSVSHNRTHDGDEPPEGPAAMDVSVHDNAQNIQYGVRFSDGDASVPLLSLGYMCQKWKEPKSSHNPSAIHVYTREKKHVAEISLSDPGRGGPLSGEHVDILGNVGVIEDVIRIATGYEVEEKVDREVVVSELKEITRRIDGHPLGGLKNALL